MVPFRLSSIEKDAPAGTWVVVMGPGRFVPTSLTDRVPKVASAGDASDVSMTSLAAAWAEVFRDAGEVTVGKIVDGFADRGFGLLLVVLALPTLVPVLPPGTAALIGLVYMLLALQMLWGAREPWVPQRVRDFRLQGTAARTLGDFGRRTIARITRVTRGGRAWHLPERVYTRAVALAVLLLGLVLFTPMPFLNTLPAVAVMLLGVGLLNHDGVMVLAGMLTAVAVVVIAIGGAGTLYAMIRHILLPAFST